jgi:CDP-glucose 4,6-dehydratase
MEILNTYKNKKVFLTGHTGFKGSWLLSWLHKLGANVKGYALTPENENDLYNLIEGEKLCHSIIDDIRNKEKLKQEILSFEPDFIFHLAAQPLVRLSYKLPIDTFNINSIGTANVLEAVRALKKPCSIVLITTDKVYENKEWIYPYRESDRLGGYDPYSASKACAELIISSYKNSFFHTSDFSKHLKGIAVGRAGNVIGGGDWAVDRIVPDVIKALSQDKEIIVRNPNAIRPWQHVIEPISGYLSLGVKLAENPQKFSNAYNFGPNIEDNLTVEELVKIAIKVYGKGEYVIPVLENQPHEAGLLKLDTSKASEELNWKPKYNSVKAIELSIDWYKTFFEDRGMIATYTKNQITNFFNE